MVAALLFGHQAIQAIVETQLQMAKEIGKAKREVQLFTLDETLVEKVYNRASSEINDALDAPHSKHELQDALDALRDSVVVEYTDPEDTAEIAQYKEAYEETFKRVVRSRILDQHKRPDGRNLTEIRPIWCEVGISPRAHGSGLFTRGETQVLTLATLGTPKEAQEIDTLSPNDSKALHASLQLPALLHR